MTDPSPLPDDRSSLRRMALSRWDNEGGASPPEAEPAPPSVQTTASEISRPLELDRGEGQRNKRGNTVAGRRFGALRSILGL